MAISTKVITMRQGNKADYQASKMLAGELAVINDTEELHFSPNSGKSIRVATENDLKELENKIPSGGGTPFSGSAKDVTYDDTETKLGATNVQDAISKVSEQIGNQTGGTGWTTTQIDLLDEIGNYIPFTSSVGGQKWDALIESLRGNSSGGEEEPDTPEVTLSSISATYSGGSVLVGTSVNALTGIVVTAKYSDGSTKTVTGYTLSGTIAEGSNTVTISYGGKSTTITVIGYAENEPEVTLTSISATYSGGDVEIGTSVNALTGITVTGHYSNGSTSTITGYTLSGEIVDGENTITVSYGGLTTTFTVNGYDSSNVITVVNGFISDSSTATSEVTANPSYPKAWGTANAIPVTTGDIVTVTVEPSDVQTNATTRIRAYNSDGSYKESSTDKNGAEYRIYTATMDGFVRIANTCTNTVCNLVGVTVENSNGVTSYRIVDNR